MDNNYNYTNINKVAIVVQLGLPIYELHGPLPCGSFIGYRGHTLLPSLPLSRNKVSPLQSHLGRKYFLSPGGNISSPSHYFSPPPSRNIFAPRNKVSTLMLIATFTSIECTVGLTYNIYHILHRR